MLLLLHLSCETHISSTLSIPFAILDNSVHTEPDFARDSWDDEMRTKIKNMVRFVLLLCLYCDLDGARLTNRILLLVEW